MPTIQICMIIVNYNCNSLKLLITLAHNSDFPYVKCNYKSMIRTFIQMLIHVVKFYVNKPGLVENYPYKGKQN